MITWIYDSQKTMRHQGDALNGEDITGYCIAADMVEPPTDVPNAAKMFIMDWQQLDSAAQSGIGSQLLMYDAEGKRWLPQ